MSIGPFALVKKIRLLNDGMDVRSAETALRLRRKEKSPNQKEQDITGDVPLQAHH